MTEWGWYKDSATKDVFLHLLLAANWRDGEYLGIPVFRGQAVFGLKSLSKHLGISIQSVRTALEHLKSTHEVTIQSTNRFSIATIVKFNDYQIESDTDNIQTNTESNKRLTNDQQTTNNIQEGKKGRKKEEITIKSLIATCSPDFQMAFLEFSEMRTKIKHPLTVRAANMALSKLDELAYDDAGKIAILNQSVFHSWQGLFKVKDQPENSGDAPVLGYGGIRRLGDD